MESFIVVMMILGVVGIGVFFWNLFAMDGFRKALIREADEKKLTVDLTSRPKTIQQYRDRPDSTTFIQYFRLLDEFDRMAVAGKMAVTSTELAMIKNSVSGLYFPLYSAKHKVRIYVTAGLWLLMIPVSFWFLVVAAAFWVFAASVQAKHLTRFESLMNQYFSPVGEPIGEAVKSSAAAQVLELNKLREQGVITEEEFSKLKTRAVNQG